jgi:methylenetetrahydrofolate--tRNA-(uracil-5-)-methyltransferase
LTSEALAADLAKLSGEDYLYFFDALCPIVEADSIDMSIAFRQSRYGRGTIEEGDYINCPLNEEEFNAFYDALVAAERIELRDFEQDADGQPFFERCLPIEVQAERGRKALAFGPMRPVGLRDPRTGQRPYAVVQLRQDNVAGSLYNLVGFQTNLKWGEQAEVLRMIPGLGEAEFVRLGQMHRNTFVNSPTLLHPTLSMRAREDLHLAGQITGIEGYAGNAASGIVAGANAARRLLGQPQATPPPDTMLGALCHYVTHAEAKHFQPMKANFGIIPDLETRVRGKRHRYAAYAERALASQADWLADVGWNPPDLAAALAERMSQKDGADQSPVPSDDARTEDPRTEDSHTVDPLDKTSAEPSAMETA